MSKAVTEAATISAIAITEPLIKQNVLIENIMSGAVKIPPPKINPQYRYYQCHMGDVNILECKKIENQNVLLYKNEKLISINKYIPEMFDKSILKYEWMPNDVKIDNSS